MLNFLNVALNKPSSILTSPGNAATSPGPAQLASLVNWDEPVSNAYSTIRRDWELPVSQNQEFGQTLHVPFKPIQDTQTPEQVMQQGEDFRPLFLSKVTIEITVPAIRHYTEKVLKRYEVCEKGCRDKTQCTHRFKLKVPVYYTNCLGELVPKRISLEIGKDTAMRTNFYQQEILDDLSVPRMQNTDEEVGRHYTEGDQIDWARSAPELTVTNTVLFPPFQNTSLGLPVLLFWRSPITLKIDLCKLGEAYFANDAKLPKLLFEDREINKRDVRVRCFVEVLQSQDERLMNNLNYLAKPIVYYWPYFENHTGLIDVEGTMDRDTGFNTLTLQIRGELLEILWILVPHRKVLSTSSQHQTHRAEFVQADPTHNPFNWSGHQGEDPILQAELCVNNIVQVSARDAKFFRSNTHKVHTNKPKAKIYGYSFSPVPNRAEINCGSLVVLPNNQNSHTVPIHIRLKFQPYVQYCRWYVLIRRPNRIMSYDGYSRVEQGVPDEIRY